MSHALPFVSICILNYNGRPYIKECLASVYDMDYPKENFEVVFIDNASTDNSAELVKNNFPTAKITQFPKNYGFAEAYNKTIKNLDSRYFALLNIDTKVTRNWLIELVKAMNSGGDIAACGSKMLFFDRPHLINHAGGQITLAGLGYDIGFGRQDQSVFNAPGPVSAACGGAMLIKKEPWVDAGGFDPGYFMYFEDIDFCWRCWLYGYKVLYVPASIVYHKYSGITGRGSSSKIYFTQKNHLLNIFKNLELHNAVKGLIVSLCLDCIKIADFLLHLEFKKICSLLKGDIAFLSSINATIKKRKVVQGKRRLSDAQLINMGIIDPLFRSLKEYQRLRTLTIKR